MSIRVHCFAITVRVMVGVNFIVDGVRFTARFRTRVRMRLLTGSGGLELLVVADKHDMRRARLTANEDRAQQVAFEHLRVRVRLGLRLGLGDFGLFFRDRTPGVGLVGLAPLQPLQ